MEIIGKAMLAGFYGPFRNALDTYDFHFGRALANGHRFLAMRWDSDVDVDVGG